MVQGLDALEGKVMKTQDSLFIYWPLGNCIKAKFLQSQPFFAVRTKISIEWTGMYTADLVLAITFSAPQLIPTWWNIANLR